MLERMQPYVGVSGVVSPRQQSELEQMFVDSGLRSTGRRLQLGVKAVHKTQYLDTINKFGEAWYPTGSDSFMGAVSQSRNKTAETNLAQVYFDAERVVDQTYRNEFIARIFERGHSWLDGVQLDLLPWHVDSTMLSMVQDIKLQYNRIVILQCHGEAMAKLGPKQCAQTLGAYASSLDYILFDSSHGKGVRLDTTALRPYIEAAYNNPKLDEVGIGIAGGLNAEIVLTDMPELLADYPDISWDAEGQLHPALPDGKRPLNMPTVYKYIEASKAILDTANE